MIKKEYIYSRLSSNSIESLLNHHYNLEEISSCIFYILGLHDNYLIKCKNNQYMLRVYRNDWRTNEEVDFELELLNYLQAKKQAVSYPIKTKDQTLSFEVSYPEGNRSMALFSYADGKALSQEISLQESRILGQSVANIHKTSNNFKTNKKRKSLNLTHLLYDSLLLIKPYITPDELSFLKSISNIIASKISTLNRDTADYGICLGDVNSSNFHITPNNRITLFDFDQCGYGYRTFELGKYLSSQHFHSSKEDIMEAFIQGYETVRTLTNEERETIPYFEIASVIWVMSIRVANKQKVGQAYLEKDYWKQRIGIVKSLVDNI